MMTHIHKDLFRTHASSSLPLPASTYVFNGATRDDIAFWGQLFAASLPPEALQDRENPLTIKVDGTTNSGKSTLHDMITYQFFGVEEQQRFRGESSTIHPYLGNICEIAFFDRDAEEWQKQMSSSSQPSKLEDIPSQRQHGGITIYQNSRKASEFVGPVDVSITQSSRKADPALKSFFNRKEDGLPVTAHIQVYNAELTASDNFQFLKNLMQLDAEDLVPYLEKIFEENGIPEVVMHWLEGKYPKANWNEMENDYGIVPGPLEQSLT